MGGTTTKEGALLTDVLLRVSKSNLIRLFRNNIGIAIMGKIKFSPNGDAQVKQPRFIHYGIPGEGGSDLLGYRTLTITPEMVGTRIAQFVACELKTPIGKLSPQQENFIRVVNEAGGLGVVVRSVRDAEELLGLD